MPPSPGIPASAAECSARSRLLAASPGSHPSPGWWACGATERAKRRPQFDQTQLVYKSFCYFSTSFDARFTFFSAIITHISQHKVITTRRLKYYSDFYYRAIMKLK